MLRKPFFQCSVLVLLVLFILLLNCYSLLTVNACNFNVAFTITVCVFACIVQFLVVILVLN